MPSYNTFAIREAGPFVRIKLSIHEVVVLSTFERGSLSVYTHCLYTASKALSNGID